MSLLKNRERIEQIWKRKSITDDQASSKVNKITRCVLALLIVFVFGTPTGVLPTNFAIADEKISEDASEENTSLHVATKITVDAFPVKDDGETWETQTSKGKSAATSKITSRGGILRLRVSVVWDDGQTISESDSENWSSRPGFSQGFTYESSDFDKLTVDSRGIMTALDNGEATVRVIPNNEVYKDLSASIKITMHNQKGGLMATKVTIVNENNKAYGDDPIKFTKLQQTKNIYARVTFTNTDASELKAAIDKKLKSALVTLDNEKQEKSKKAGDEAEEQARLEATAEWEKKKEVAEAAEEEWTEADEKKAQQAIKQAAREARAQARAKVDEAFSEKIEEAKGKAEQEAAEIREKIIYSNAPDAPSDEKPTDYEKEHYYKTVEEAFSTLVWQVGDTEYLTAINHNGVLTLKAKANAMTRLYAVISGGDASKDKGFGAGRVYGSVSVNVNDAERARADGEMPADSLTIKVIYEKMPDTIAIEKTYTVEEFEKLGAITRTYTMTQKGGKYVTDRAYGVPLATILTKFKIDADDVSYFTLAANDNANPGKLSAKFLLRQARYYLPNYDLGGSWQEKEQVPTMLALKDSWNSNTTVTGELNEGTRFRLVFGSVTSADQVTDKSIKFINTFTIVMKGAPPSTNGDDDTNVDQGGDNGSGTGSGSGGGSGSESNGDNNNGSSSSASQSTVPQSDSERSSGAGSEKTQQEAKETPWSIYEMMNNSKSDVQVELEENPLLPWALPSTLLLCFIAAAWRLLIFRRQLGNKSQIKTDVGDSIEGMAV